MNTLTTQFPHIPLSYGLLDQLNDAVFVLSKDLDVEHANQAALNLLKCELSDIINTSWTRYCREWTPTSCQTNTTTNGEPSETTIKYLDISVRCRISYDQPAPDDHITLLVKPIRHEIYSMDSELLIDALSEVIFFKNTDGTIILPSKQIVRDLGLDSPDLIIGKTDSDLFEGEFPHITANDEKEVIKTGKPKVDSPYTLQTPENNTIHGIRTLLPIKDHEGTIIAIAGTNRNTTKTVLDKKNLQDHHNQLVTTNQIAQIAYWEYNCDNDIYSLNEQACQIMHRSKEDFGGYAISFDILSKVLKLTEEDLAVIRNEIKKALSTNDPNYQSYFRHGFTDGRGERQFIKVTVFVSLDDHNKVKRLYGTKQIITEEFLKELSAKEDQVILEQTFESAKIGRVKYDIRKQILHYSPQALKVIRYPKADIPHDLHSLFRCIDPSDRDLLIAENERCKQTGMLDVEFRVTINNVTQWYQLKLMLQENPFDKKKYLFGILQNTTDQKRIENNLRQREQELIRACRIAKLAPWRFDLRKGKFVLNDLIYELIGTSIEQEGSYLVEYDEWLRRFVVPTEQEKLFNSLNELFAQKDENKVIKFENNITYANGQKGHAQTYMHVTKDENGKVDGAVGILQDINDLKSLQVKLKENEASIKNAHKVAQIGTWKYIKPEDRFEYSPEALMVFDFPEDPPLKSTDCPHYIHPEDIDKVYGIFKNKNGATALELEFRSLTKDDRYKWIKLNVSITYDTNGLSTVVDGLVQDIDKQRSAEEKLYAAYDIAQMGHWYYSFQDRSFLLNDQFYNLAKTSIGQIGSYILNLEQFAQQFLPSESHPYFYNIFEGIYKTGDLSLHDREYIAFLFGDGSTGWISNSMRPEKNKEGILKGILGVSINVTERKKLQDQQKANEKVIATGYEISKMAHWSYSLKDGLYTFNDQFYRLAGTSATEIGGYTMTFEEHLNKFVAPEDHDEIMEAFSSFAATGSLDAIHNKIFNVPKGDGTRAYAKVRMQLQYDDQGTPIGAIGVTQDVTETKNLENQLLSYQTDLENKVKIRTAELEQSNIDLEAFAYSISHDLRSPLRHINGYATIIQHKTDEIAKDKLYTYLNNISESANQMGNMIDALLAYSTYSRQDLNITEINLNHNISKIIERSEEKLTNRKVLWDIQPLPKINGDKDLIYMVLSNIIGNAVKYTEKREIAKISVKISEETDHTLTIAIADNGIGFNMEYADELFGVFRRLHNSKAFEGSGIGLAHAQQIVRKHGGEIWAEGKINEGATFYIKLKKTN